MKIPKLRFKEFSGEWEEKRLEQLCDDFIVPMRDKPKDLTGIIPWCRIEDFKGKYLSTSKSNQGVSKETVEEMNLKIFPIDTLLVSCSANLGKCAIVKKELITNQTFIGLIPNKDTINIEYFYYLMTLQEKKLNLISTGTTISYLSKDEFKNYKVLLSLNLQEQEKIADFLSSVDKKISLTEEKLNLFKEYKKGMMQKIFKQEIRFKDSNGNDYPTWVKKRLGDIFSFKQGYQIPFKEQIKTKEKGYVRYLYISDFFSDKNLLYVKDDGKEKITETDITVANTGNTAGSFYRGKSGILSNNMFNIQNDEKVVINDFLFQFLGTSLYSNQLKTFFNSSGQPHLGHKNMSMIIINYPISFEEQEKIAKFLSSIDNKIENLSTELENLKLFKKGLLQKMFI